MRTINIIIFFIVFSLIFLLILQQRSQTEDFYFSHKSGFYDNQFFLKIKTGKNYKIFYTLDSSVPTVNSIPYSKPILIKDASSNPNVLSARSDMTFQHYFDNKIQKIPNSPVDKAVIVRAALFDQNNNLLNQDYRVFFVGFNKKNGYKNLPVVSVIMNPDDIIDGKHGIFVLGNKKQSDITSCFPKREYSINFCKDDKNMERNAIVDIFNEQNKEIIFSHKTGIKIKGSQNRELIQKSMSLYAQEEYTAATHFGKNVFNKDLKLYSFTLFSGGKDLYTKIKDYIVQTTESKINSHFSTLKMIPCSVFLNGEYWGVYYLSENYDEYYIKTHYNLDIMNIIKAEGLRDYQIVENINLTDNLEYEKIAETVDIESFVDYCAMQIYIANSDWAEHLNERWRTIYKDETNKYADKKWRFVLSDLTSNNALSAYDYDSIKNAIETCPIFNALIKNKSFKEKFIQRIRFLESQVYTPENMNLLIDDWLSIMKDPVFKSNERFLHENANFIFDKEINNIRKFFELRPQYINLYIDKHLGKE